MRSDPRDLNPAGQQADRQATTNRPPRHTWQVAITDSGYLADGHLGSYDTASEAVETAAATFTLVIRNLHRWAAAADPDDPRAARATEIAGRLSVHVQQLQRPATEQQYADLLEPNYSCTPLNTLALDEDAMDGREPFVDDPVPLLGRWSDRPLWLQIWTTPIRGDVPTPRPPAMHTPPPARHVPPLTRLRRGQP